MIRRLFGAWSCWGRFTRPRGVVLSAMLGGSVGCTTEGAVREQPEVEAPAKPVETAAKPIEAPAETGRAAEIPFDEWYRVSEVQPFDDEDPPYVPGELTTLFIGINFGRAWVETRVICLGDLSFDHAKREDVTYHRWFTGMGVAQFRWEDDGRLWLGPNMAFADSRVLELERERHADGNSTWTSHTTNGECTFSLPDGHFAVDVQERDADGRFRRFALTDPKGKTWYLMLSQGYPNEKGVDDLIIRGLSKAR
jgi:hypothetical protein